MGIIAFIAFQIYGVASGNVGYDQYFGYWIEESPFTGTGNNEATPPNTPQEQWFQGHGNHPLPTSSMNRTLMYRNDTENEQEVWFWGKYAVSGFTATSHSVGFSISFIRFKNSAEGSTD